MSASGGREGIRKDSISHGIRSAIMKAGGYPTYFNDMRKKLPTKFADMVSKYIPQEIEQTMSVQHNVLIVNMPEPRRLNTSEVKELAPIVDAECEE
jgi:hypothetical protein